MATPFMHGIYAFCVPMMRLTKKLGQTQLLLGYSDQVNVIRHQAVCPDVDTGFDFQILYQLDVGSIVRIIKKRLLPPNATLSDVVGITGYNQPRKLWHLALPVASLDGVIKDAMT